MRFGSAVVVWLSFAAAAARPAAAQTTNGLPSVSELARSAREGAAGMSAPPSSPLPETRVRVDGMMPYKYPAPRPIDIDAAALGDCLALVTEQFGHAALLRGRMNEPFRSSYFFHYLCAYPDREADYSTGREEALKKWIMGRPDDSIDPVSLYRESLSLNGGNVWNALLAIHQLLRNHARYFDKNAYSIDLTESDAGPLFNKFVDIRGDLKDRDKNLHGDHRGTWYRIWGMMLYRLQQEPESDEMIGPRARPGGAVELYRNEKSAAVATLAEWEKILSDHPDGDARKAEVNRKAAAVADVLVRSLYEGKSYPSDAERLCEGRSYLSNPAPGRSKRAAAR